MTVCTLCQRPNKSAIDDALMQGISVRAVGAQFGVSKSAVARHRTGCLAPVVAAAAKIVAPAAEIRGDVERAKDIVAGKVAANHDDILSLTALLGRLARSLERLEGAADTAAGDGLHMPLAALSGQLHRGIESAAKIQGMYAEPQQVTGDQRFSLVINLPAVECPPVGLRNITPLPDEAIDADTCSLTIRFAGTVV